MKAYLRHRNTRIHKAWVCWISFMLLLTNLSHWGIRTLTHNHLKMSRFVYNLPTLLPETHCDAYCMSSNQSTLSAAAMAASSFSLSRIFFIERLYWGCSLFKLNAWKCEIKFRQMGKCLYLFLLDVQQQIKKNRGKELNSIDAISRAGAINLVSYCSL